jgi:antitoxin YefM
MEAVNYSELRRNLKTHLDRVYHDHDPLIITRKDNENVVVISLDDYNSLTETQYLLSTKANTEHLLRSLEESRNEKIKSRELIEE